MTDQAMQTKLRAMPYVETVTLRVVNKIREVRSDRVVVRSARTGNDREISFEQIRGWSRGRSNSRVRLALAVALGLTKQQG